MDGYNKFKKSALRNEIIIRFYLLVCMSPVSVYYDLMEFFGNHANNNNNIKHLV